MLNIKNIIMFIAIFSVIVFFVHVIAVIENFKQYDNHYQKRELTQTVNHLHDVLSLQNNLILNNKEK